MAAAHPFARLLDSRVGQPDQGERWQDFGVEIDFYLDDGAFPLTHRPYDDSNDHAYLKEKERPWPTPW